MILSLDNIPGKITRKVKLKER